jgi:hypothetical protein
MKFLNLSANAVFRKRVLDLSRNVTIDVSQAVTQKHEHDQGDDTDGRGNRSNHQIAAIEKPAAPALWRHGMSTLGITIGSSLRFGRQRLVGVRL